LVALLGGGILWVSSRGAEMRKKFKGRMTTPLVRDGDSLREATWDEALDYAAAGLARVRATDTSTSFGMFSCSKATNEMNFLAQKFARQVMGSNNIDSCNRT
jgi:formate dehydrogenase major subunit